MESYKSPLPLTWTELVDLLLSTTRATSFYAYSLNLTLRSFRASLDPSVPAKGEVLTLIETPIKGSSILRQGIVLEGYPSSTSV